MGGSDRGPVGGEYQLVALGGCFTSHLLAAIRAREVQINNLKVEVTGTLDGLPERFTEFGLTVSAKCDDIESLRQGVTIAENLSLPGCEHSQAGGAGALLLCRKLSPSNHPKLSSVSPTGRSSLKRSL